ncbi:MAG TPA: HNH endonuclease [Stellaceae bacterium]|nr:HNH endonuclease [Stellaceae bacterium]
MWSNDFNNSGMRKSLKLYKDRDGYHVVWLTIGGARRIHAVRKLVALTFLGERPPKMQINHKNGIRNDDREDNLEYLTSRENTLHGWARGRKHSKKQLLASSKAMTAANMRRWHPEQYAA